MLRQDQLKNYTNRKVFDEYNNYEFHAKIEFFINVYTR